MGGRVKAITRTASAVKKTQKKTIWIELVQFLSGGTQRGKILIWGVCGYQKFENPCLIYQLQQGISFLVSSKLQTIPRFKGIKQMWVGADFSNTTNWQWRGYFQNFKGIFYCGTIYILVNSWFH